MVYPDLAEAEREYGMSGIRAMLQHNGLVHLELEGLPNWWADGPLREQSDEIRRALLAAAEQLGARHIKVTPDDSGTPWSREQWAKEFAALAAQAHDVNPSIAADVEHRIRILTASKTPRYSNERKGGGSQAGTST